MIAIKSKLYAKPYKINKTPKIKPLKALDLHTINLEAHYINEAITTFTMVYCGLNWLMYNRINKK